MGLSLWASWADLIPSFFRPPSFSKTVIHGSGTKTPSVHAALVTDRTCKYKVSDSFCLGPREAKATLVRTWAGEGRWEEGEAETLGSGRRREGAGRRETGCGINRDGHFFSDRLQEEQTNGSTPASAKGEIRKEIRGDRIVQVVAGSA